MAELKINYSGMNLAIPQSDSPAGSCQEIINARFEKGCWRPIPKKKLHSFRPSAVFTYSSSTITFDRIFFHDIENGIVLGQPNWIGLKIIPQNGATAAYGRLFSINADNTCELILDNINTETDIDVVFLKRTMIVASGDGVLVFLFNQDKKYVQTATLPVPDIDITTANLTSKTTEFAKLDNAKDIAASALGYYYALLNSESQKDGKMFGSIMYITAYKLFDGSYILPCIPKYLKISTGGTIKFTNWYGKGNYSVEMTISLANLKATVNNELYTTEIIGDTKDLVQSICVFATKATPLHLINETTVTETTVQTNIPGNGGNTVWNTKEFKDFFPANKEFGKLAMSQGWYLISEFTFDDVVGQTGRTTKDVDSVGFYQDYATRDTLTTDQFTHHKLSARSAYVYNDRLHLLNIKTSFGLPYVIWPDSDMNYGSLQSDDRQGKITVWLKTSIGKSVRQSTTSIPLYREAITQSILFSTYGEAETFITGLPTNEEYPNFIVGSDYIETAYVEENGTGQMIQQFTVYFKTLSGSGDYLFILPEIVGYNDNRAYKMQISVWSGSEYVVLFEESLTKNDTMNFAVWHNKSFDANQASTTANFPKTKKNVSLVTLPATIATEIGLPFDTNRLQVSEIQNPLIFPAKYSYQIGTGDGITMMSGSEPLSQGQFGQFPLQVFTTKGIWALEIGTGDVLYTNVLPGSSEVIDNKLNVISIGDGVLYSTVKGLSILIGRDPTEIAEVVEGIPYENITGLSEIAKLIENSELNIHFTPGLENSLSDIDFLEYLQTSSIGYDQPNKELIVTNKNKQYSYIYSLESKVWYKISHSYDLLINDYPRLVGVRGNNVYTISEEDETQHIEVLIISNAQNFTLPDVNKQIERVIQRTSFKTNVSKVGGFYVFASDDLEKWQLISGKQKDGDYIKDLLVQQSHISAKYFMFVFNGLMSCNSEIKTIEISFKQKFTSKLR